MNTSDQAKKSIDAGTLRKQVLDFIAAQPDGATCDEIEAALDLRHQTASARVRELFDAGAINRPGNTRATRSGRQAEVCYEAGQFNVVMDGPFRAAPSPTSRMRTSGKGWQCKRCGCDTVWDTPIHNGNSVRRDCARCGRTDGFPIWKGQRGNG